MTTITAHHPREVSSLRAAAYLIFRPNKYLDIAPSHDLAINLKASDLGALYQKGTFPSQGWDIESRASAAAERAKMRSALARSFAATAAVSLLVLIGAFALGVVSSKLPVSWPKVFGAVGGYLATWATLFALTQHQETWKGQSLHELAKPVIVWTLVTTGAAVAALGQLL